MRELPDVLTPITHRGLATALRAALPEMSSRGIVVLVGHVAVETGMRACHCWNLGNVKSSEGDGRDFVFFACGEEMPEAVATREAAAHPDLVELRGKPYVRDGKRMQSVWVRPRHPWSRFRAFETLEAGAADYIGILRLPRYRAAWDILPSGDVVAFSDALYRGGYFTASPRTYRIALAREVTRTRGVLMGRPTLRRGSTGEHVEAWQEAALEWRKAPAKDGRFGPQTEAATRRWQVRHNLLNDGEVGPMSWGTVFPNVEVDA